MKYLLLKQVKRLEKIVIEFFKLPTTPYLFLLSWIFILFKLAQGVLDPDFGWHIQMGNIIQNNGIPPTDPFSYTMPSYPFVDHEWLTNMILMKLSFYPNEISVLIFGSLVVASLLLSITNPLSRSDSPFHFHLRSYVLLILSFGIVLHYFGVRPQILSWLFLALFLRILLDEKIYGKLWFVLPVLMVVWVNLHGSFVEGIVVIILIVAGKSWRMHRLSLKNIFTIALVVAASFLNPYGWRSWWEVWMQITDSSLRWSIAEWRPAIFVPQFSFMVMMTLSSLLVWKYRNRYLLEEKLLFIVLSFQSLSSVRHIPLWLVTVLPLTYIGIAYLIEEVVKFPFGLQRFRMLSLPVLSGVFLLVLGEIYVGHVSSPFYSGYLCYPEDAVKFLKQQKIEGNIFSHYNWGGYLIWQYPEKKVFIDGRMPSWRRNEEIPGESKYAMKDYASIMDQGKYQHFFEKYNIKYVLLPKTESGERRNFFKIKLPKAINNFFHREPSTDLKKNLEDDSWKLIYEDSTATIYQKD